jgi:hypothetical protein
VVGVERVIPVVSQFVIFERHGRKDGFFLIGYGAFKDIVTMAVDPVCGMAVERERAVRAERDGEALFFCSRGVPRGVPRRPARGWQRKR